jgi:hypothetical protein
VLGEAPERPMLEHAHRSRLFPQDLGDAGYIQPGKHAEQNHLSLVGRKRGDPRERSFGVVGGEDGALGIFRPGSRRESVEAATRIESAIPAAPMIDQAAASDREEPSPERPFITLETVESARRVKPRLRGEILAVVRILRP